jgi:hypothetical protein
LQQTAHRRGIGYWRVLLPRAARQPAAAVSADAERPAAHGPGVVSSSPHDRVSGGRHHTLSMHPADSGPDPERTYSSLGTPRSDRARLCDRQKGFPMTAIGTAARLIAATAVAAAAPLVVTTTAEASTPESVCGSGFYEVDHHTLPNGTIYLLYNGTENCAVTWKTNKVGTATGTAVRLQVQGESTIHQDTDNYKYYAGPVKASAKGKCVQWGGVAFDYAIPGLTAFGIGAPDGWISPYNHCLS